MKQGPPHDTEEAFDTGATFECVFTMISKTIKPGQQISDKIIEEASQETLRRFGR